MWQVKYEGVFPGLTRSAAWAVWTDVEGWAQWDEDIDYARLSGPFVAGAKIRLRPKGGPEVKIEVTSVVPLVSFTDVTRFPLARMIDVHEIEDSAQGVKLRNHLWVEGPLAWLWRRLVAQGVAAGIPRQMQALAQRAAAQAGADAA